MTAFLKRMLTVLIDEALMPTGENLVPALFFAITITVINITVKLFGGKAGFNTMGCITAVVLLLVLLVIERSEYRAVSKLYRDVELRVKDIKTRQQAVRADRKNGRAVRSNKELRHVTSGRANNGRKGGNNSDGFDVGDSDSEE